MPNEIMPIKEYSKEWTPSSPEECLSRIIDDLLCLMAQSAGGFERLDYDCTDKAKRAVAYTIMQNRRKGDGNYLTSEVLYEHLIATGLISKETL